MNRLLFLSLLLPALAGAATIITVDTSTTLLDSSTFTAGTPYTAAFQFTGNGITSNSATVSNIDLGGGTGETPGLGDITDPTFTVGPNGADPLGIWQANGTLTLFVGPLDASSVYTQQFTSGNQFSFAVELTGNLSDGAPPDTFTFQLYDAELSNLLYEVTVDATTGVPEPSTAVTLLTGAGILLALGRGRR